MSSSGGPVEELRGISEADDVKSIDDAQRLFDLEPPITDDDVNDRHTELVLNYHPDTGGGTTELFRAIEKAEDILLGERAPEEASGKARGQTTTPGEPDDEGVGETFTGGVGGTSSEDFDRLVNLVKDLLRANRGKSEEIDSLIDQFGMDEVAPLMARLILNGAIDLGDIEKMVSPGGDNRFGSQRGGDERFGRGGSSGDSRFGGGDRRFG
jgi:curved DNA-binding protein CbpA